MVTISVRSPGEEGRRDTGVSITSKDRPQNPVEGTSWTNPVTKQTEIFFNGQWSELEIVNALLASNNLSDITNASTARTNLGLGSLSTQNADSVNFTGRVRLGAISSKNADYTITSSDCTILCTGGAGGITMTLPAANSSSNIIIIRKIDAGAGAITVARAGSDTIDGATSISLAAQYDTCVLLSDGSGAWHRIV